MDEYPHGVLYGLYGGLRYVIQLPVFGPCIDQVGTYLIMHLNAFPMYKSTVANLSIQPSVGNRSEHTI